MKTIREKLIASFSIFIVLMLLLVGGITWMSSQSRKIVRFMSETSEIGHNMLRISKLEKDFLNDEVIKPDLYLQNTNSILQKRDKIVQDIGESLRRLTEDKAAKGFIEKDSVVLAFKDFETYCRTFDTLMAYQKKRGFKNFGIEGKMRENAHYLENHPDIVSIELLLNARRHEKDFMLRKETKYLYQFEQAIRKIKKAVLAKPESWARLEVLKNIEDYEARFMELVVLENKIGHDFDSGLKGDLAGISKSMSARLEGISHGIRVNAEEATKKAQTTSIILMSACLLFAVSASYYITSSISRPIEALTLSIRQVVQSNFDGSHTIAWIESKDEVGKLAKASSLMLRKVVESMAEIQAKSDKVAKSKQQLMDSIRYAKKMQEAVLPDAKDLAALLGDSFVLYQPKDLVSGDFYWVAKKRDMVFVALSDCTGHGVPGAFLSMIGMMLLNKIVTEEKVFAPSAILEKLHLEIKGALKQGVLKGKKNSDGMDIGVCRLSTRPDGDTAVCFAGAKQSLSYFQEGRFETLKGSKRSIGGEFLDEQKVFDSHDMVLKPSACLYLYSDGFADQNNPEGLKFGKKAFYELLASVARLGLLEQKLSLEETLMAFRKSTPLRDDVSVLGFRLRLTEPGVLHEKHWARLKPGDRQVLRGMFSLN